MAVQTYANAAARAVNSQMGSDKSDSSGRQSADPFLGLRYWVDLGDDLLTAGFRECSALTIETETFEYAEGGLNSYTHKLPVRTKYSNITLKRGFDQGHDLFEWYIQTINGTAQKRHISIQLYDVQGKLARRWDLANAYPVKWIGPDLKSDSGAIAVETIEIAHEGLLPSSTTSGPPDGQPRVRVVNPEDNDDNFG